MLQVAGLDLKLRSAYNNQMKFRNPLPTVDVIIRTSKGIVLIKRKNKPFGWALPGGFIDYGESAEDAARRETKEETSLTVRDLKQFRVYSSPGRDPRFHTLSVVFTARANGEPRARDDAADIGIFRPRSLPSPLAFDHRKILNDYFRKNLRR
jgi:ADP-ribose pyrophosphatase YjhB (NUDIX family)